MNKYESKAKSIKALNTSYKNGFKDGFNFKVQNEFTNKRLLLLLPDGIVVDMNLIKSVKVEKDVIITMGV